MTGSRTDQLVTDEMVERAARSEWEADLDGQPNTDELWAMTRDEYVPSMRVYAHVKPDIDGLVAEWQRIAPVLREALMAIEAEHRDSAVVP